MSEEDADIVVDRKLEAAVKRELIDKLKALGLNDKVISEVCNIAVLVAQKHFDKWTKNLEKRLQRRANLP
jgi:hypothetical protein